MKNVIALWLVMLMPAAAASDSSLAQLVDVRIYDRATQRELPLVSSGGRYYVAGTPGNAYSIRVLNRAGEDVLAVVSVDGVNVVSGETAAVGQSGYILGRGQRFDIKGWRKSLDEVAAFYFSRPEDAYATRTGRPEDLGVIGVAAKHRGQGSPGERGGVGKRIRRRCARAAGAAPRNRAWLAGDIGGASCAVRARHDDAGAVAGDRVRHAGESGRARHHSAAAPRAEGFPRAVRS
jgi:hypothetical protein